jgi:hypothetical protein
MRYHEILEHENLSPEQYVNAAHAAIKQARWVQVHTPKPAPGQYTAVKQSSGTTIFSVAVSINGKLTHDVLVKALAANNKSAEANDVTISELVDQEGSDWTVGAVRGLIQQFTIG